MWIIGIDGGGTKCKASLFDPQGKLLVSSETGPANLFMDFELAISSIDEACKQVIDSANKKLAISLQTSDCFLSLGCAGASITAVQDKFVEWKHAYADAILTTDIHISCLAANHGNDCALVITGTGSCIAIYQQQSLNQYGGHGFLLGDIASGAWLGKNAVSWYLKALDIPHNDVTLFELLRDRLGTNVNPIIQQYGHAPPVKFAELVPYILSAVDNSFTLQKWIKEGLDYLQDILAEHTHPQTDIFIDGGIAHVYQQALGKMMSRSIARPNNEAVYGAYAYAKQHVLGN